MAPKAPGPTLAEGVPVSSTSRVERWSQQVPILVRLVREALEAWAEGAKAKTLALRHTDPDLAYECQAAWLLKRRWVEWVPGFPRLKIEAPNEIQEQLKVQAILPRVLSRMKQAQSAHPKGSGQEAPHLLDQGEFWGYFRSGDREKYLQSDPVLREVLSRLEEVGVTVRPID